MDGLGIQASALNGVHNNFAGIEVGDGKTVLLKLTLTTTKIAVNQKEIVWLTLTTIIIRKSPKKEL